MSTSKIQFLQKSGILLLHIPYAAPHSGFAKVPDMLAEKLGAPGTPSLSGIVIDFGSDADESKWKEFAEALNAIPGRNTFLFVAPPSTLSGKLVASGFSQKAFVSIEEVFQTIGNRRASAPKPAKMKNAQDEAFDKILIKSLQAAAIKTFEVQCSTSLKAGKPYLRERGSEPLIEIAASIGMMSKAVSGSVALGFEEATFLRIMGKMLGEQFSDLTSEVEDGCAELLNIVFGQAKRMLSEQGIQFGKTLPTTLAGQTLRVRQLTPNPGMVLPFESDLGPLVIEFGYRRT